jgi:hypothetical protein
MGSSCPETLSAMGAVSPASVSATGGNVTNDRKMNGGNISPSGVGRIQRGLRLFGKGKGQGSEWQRTLISLSRSSCHKCKRGCDTNLQFLPRLGYLKRETTPLDGRGCLYLKDCIWMPKSTFNIVRNAKISRTVLLWLTVSLKFHTR